MWKITGRAFRLICRIRVLSDGQWPRRWHRAWLIHRRNLIDQHSGKIEFTSWPGHTSSRFTCLSGNKGDVYATRDSWVVDDDSSIRWVLERALAGGV